MKKYLLFAVLLGSVTFIQAQELNFVPSSAVKSLADNWYKFESEGTTFDVEVRAGDIVKGNIKWFNNDTYSGDLVASELSGKGTYTWANGERYEGSFKSNQRSGKGTMFWNNGTKYSGKWKNNLQHGKGKKWEKDGTVVEGVWQNGTLVKTK